MDHYNSITTAAVKMTIFALGFIAALTTVVVNPGLVSYVDHAAPHPYTRLRQAYAKPPMEPRFVKPVQVLVHLDKAQFNPSTVPTPLGWSEDLVKDPHFNASYGMDQLIGNKVLNISGIELDLYMIALPSSPPTAGHTTGKDPHVEYETVLPKFKHLLPIQRATILYALESLMRIFSHLMLYNNYVIASANTFDPKSIMVLVVFLCDTFSFNHPAACWRRWSQSRAKATMLKSLRVVTKDFISNAEQDQARIEIAEASASQAGIDLSNAHQETSVAAGEAGEASKRAKVSENEVARQGEFLNEQRNRIGSLEATNEDLVQKLGSAEKRADSNQRNTESLQKELDNINGSCDDRADRLCTELESTRKLFNETSAANTILENQLEDSNRLAQELITGLRTKIVEAENSEQQIESLQGQVNTLEHQLADAHARLAVEPRSNDFESGSEEREPHSKHSDQPKKYDGYDVVERLLDTALENKDKIDIHDLQVLVQSLWQRIPKKVSCARIDSSKLDTVPPASSEIDNAEIEEEHVESWGNQVEEELGDEHLAANGLPEPSNDQNQEQRNTSDLFQDKSSNVVQQNPQVTSAPVQGSTPPSDPTPSVRPKSEPELEAEPKLQSTSTLLAPSPLSQTPPVQQPEGDGNEGFNIHNASGRARQQLPPRSKPAHGTKSASLTEPGTNVQHGRGLPTTTQRGRDQYQHSRGLPMSTQRGRDQYQHGRSFPFPGGHAPRGHDHQQRGRGVRDPNGPLHRNQDHAQRGREPAVPRGPANRGHEQGWTKKESKKEAELRQERTDLWKPGNPLQENSSWSGC